MPRKEMLEVEGREVPLRTGIMMDCHSGEFAPREWAQRQSFLCCERARLNPCGCSGIAESSFDVAQGRSLRKLLIEKQKCGAVVAG